MGALRFLIIITIYVQAHSVMGQVDNPFPCIDACPITFSASFTKKVLLEHNPFYAYPSEVYKEGSTYDAYRIDISLVNISKDTIAFYRREMCGSIVFMLNGEGFGSIQNIFCLSSVRLTSMKLAPSETYSEQLFVVKTDPYTTNNIVKVACEFVTTYPKELNHDGYQILWSNEVLLP